MLPIPFVVSCRPTIQDFATNFISGAAPGAARANGARSSIRISKASSESTRKHGGPTPRPTASKATFPKKPAGNSQPATGRTERTESETTDRRPDTRAESDSTTTRGYASATAPPPQQKQQGNTPQTRPARTSGPPHSSWKQTDTLTGLRQTGPSTFL